VGLLAAGGVTSLAVWQLWRGLKGTEIEVAADDKAVQVAQRRGYEQGEAALALVKAIEAVPALEGRQVLTVSELVRCQNLRTQTELSEIATSGGYRPR
jgi:hypothetical protein